MDEALSKIRVHTTSSLAHQKRPATLLVALESTFEEQKTEKSPTAYFAALLTTVEATLGRQDVGLTDSDVLPAQLYLLALILPFVPTSVIRSHLSTLISLTAPLFPALERESFAAPLKSQLSIYGSLFLALDRPQLDAQGTRQAFASILQLCVDKRPKVRKKAADVIKDVLASPPSPLLIHPYAERVAQWIKDALSNVSSKVFQRSKTTGDENPAITMAIHIITFVRPVVVHLLPSSLPDITNLILTLPRLGNPYLSRSSYSILSDIFTEPSKDPTSPLTPHIPSILSTILGSHPDKSDTEIAPVWLSVVGHALSAQPHTELTPDGLGRAWKAVWSYLESSVSATRQAASESLQLIISAAHASKNDAIIKKWVSQVTKSLDSLTLARSIPELLQVASALCVASEISNVQELVLKVASLRTQTGFEYKESADACLSAAMRTFGPERLLHILPLNLEPADRQAGREPRAYLLPLLAQPHVSSVKHFVDYFVPFSERMFDLQQTAESEGRQSEAKVWSVLLSQVWAGLPFYNWATADLKEALSAQFSQLLSQLLYSQPELRPPILRALKVAVESNLDLTISHRDDAPISSAQAEVNVSFLGSQAESWLAVLFNIFGTVSRENRNSVGEVITAWASVSSEKEITSAYGKVLGLLKQHLASAQTSANGDEGNVTTMTQDILLLLLPYLTPESAQTLFDLCLSQQVLNGRDNGVQKRGYKTLSKLLENEKVKVDPEVVLKQLDELADGLSSAAKKDRFMLFSQLVPLLPSTAMHVIPTLIPEAVLGTKETSEKARGAAFELVLVMGRKMSEGGIVQREKLDGIEADDDVPMSAQANIEEYMTMIAGGLAGASPHMISATVTAISRLVFEFKDAISENMHNEILTTLEVFLESNNREIVKSVLGYAKLAIHTLRADLVRPHLAKLVPALLRWSHDHKNHFKAKVRHIFERMLRRFSWDEVYACAGEEEAAKVLVNIRKRKERAKKKKAARDEEEDDEDAKPAKAGGNDAFEDVLYGSESELEDSDDDQPMEPHPKGIKRSKMNTGARLRIDDDEPMDLLEGAAAHITHTKSNKKRKPGQDATHFKTDEDTGKMIIDEEDEDSDANQGEEDVAGTAYRESISGVDGFTRGPNGRVKFNKDTAKRRRENADLDDEDVDMDATPTTKRKTKKQAEVKLGHEFKAKRAGGDVKKGGMDPYAYVSLAQASKRGKGGKNRIGIASKR